MFPAGESLCVEGEGEMAVRSSGGDAGEEYGAIAAYALGFHGVDGAIALAGPLAVGTFSGPLDLRCPRALGKPSTPTRAEPPMRRKGALAAPGVAAPSKGGAVAASTSKSSGRDARGSISVPTAVRTGE